jgi:hypothetical protein
MIIENENVNEWDNPFNYDTSVDSTDKTSGLASYRVSVKGFNSAGSPVYNSSNIAYGVGKRVLNDGQQFNSVVTVNAPFEYLMQINNKAVVNRMDIVWDGNPANIPIDYEVYYTTDILPTDVSKITWSKFERLSKQKNFYNIPLSVSTDGAINNSYQVVGNTRSLNSFTFKSVREITGIKIVVTTLMSKCNLIDFRLFTEANATGSIISKDFGTPQDFREFNTLCLDVKSNLAHKDNLRVGFLPDTETVSSVVADISASPTAKTDLTGLIVRQACRLAAAKNNSAYDRIRITLRPEPGQYIRIENVYIMIDTRSIDNSAAYIDNDVQTVIVPVTFNGGLSYYDGTPTGDVVSDWLYIDFPSYAFNAYKITFKVVSGAMRRVNVTTAEYWWTQAAQYTGYEQALNWTGYIAPTQVNDYSFIVKVEIGVSNAQYMDFDYFDSSVCEKWHRHYIKMPTGTAVQNVRKLILYFNNILADQDVFVDNVILTRDKDLAATATLSSSSGCSGEANTIGNGATYFTSDLTPTNAVPKTIMATFAANQSVNKILLYFGNRTYAGKNYSIQYSIDGTATANDPYDSPKWNAVTGVQIGESGIVNEFTGTIVDNTIYNNNLWASHIAHKFAPIVCTKIRVMFYSTIEDQPVRIMNMKIMSASDAGTLNLIYEKNTPVTVGQKFIDDGKVTQSLYPSEFNTTGSYNVIYDSTLRLIRLIDTSKQGVLHLNEINFNELFMSIIMSAQYNGNCEFYISNDNGKNYTFINLDKLYTFSTQSQYLRIKVVFKSADAAVSALALLYTL